MQFRPRIISAAVALLCVGGTLLTFDRTLAADTPPAPDSAAEPQWFMTINGKTITIDEFRIFYTERLQQARSQPSSELQSQVINDLITLTLVAEDARQRGLDKQPVVQAALALQQTQLLSQVALQGQASENKPSEEEIKKLYDEKYAGKPGTEYKARHILLKTEDEAKSVIAELKGGADFTELAKQQSTGPTGPKGGDLGWFEADQMVPSFAEALRSMKPGTYSEKPVQTQFGWHVILLEETRDAKPPSLEEATAELTAALRQKALAGYISSLREKANVELNPALTEKGEAGSEESGKEPAK